MDEKTFKDRTRKFALSVVHLVDEILAMTVASIKTLRHRNQRVT